MILHRLDGCAPAPLASYLKALGILRLVGEQLDPQARGWWEGDRFVLATTFNQAELLSFFAERYAPTPLVSPWNKGSGFYNPSDPSLAAIEKSVAERFRALRIGVLEARAQLDAIAAADAAIRAVKDESKNKSLSTAQRNAMRDSEDYRQRLAQAERQFKQLKSGLIPDLRRVWRGLHRTWMDASLVLDDEGQARFPSLFGTGGNDGRLDFTNNFFQRLTELFDFREGSGTARRGTAEQFRSALYGGPSRALVTGLAVGQFLPGGAGGANGGVGPDSGSRINPVDFVLLMEGAVVFTAAAARRLGVQAGVRAVAPFVMGARASGYASAASTEESARGEQWMPLWHQPATLVELRRLMAEGRAQVGATSAREPLQIALAAARLGTARGVQSFQRFGYIERNGQSNLAVPLGRIEVSRHKSLQLACIDDLDNWLARLHRQVRSDHAPVRLVQAEARLGNSLLALTQFPEHPRRWQELLLRMAEVEAVLAQGSGFAAGPIPRLRPQWITAADDGSPEFRLAVAFALQHEAIDGQPGRRGIRRYWLALERGGFRTSGSNTQLRLVREPNQVLAGRRGIDDAIALVQRSLLEAASGAGRRLPLQPAPATAAAPADLCAFLTGNVDPDRTLTLARALMAVDGAGWARSGLHLSPAAATATPDDAWLAIRLALLPWPLADQRQIGADPAIARRLSAGDATGAVALALRRLQALGIGSTVRVAVATPELSRRWAAALAFPITPATAARFARRLDPHSPKEHFA